MSETVWEPLPDDVCHSSRLRVPGGWIVRSIYRPGSVNQAPAMHQVFVPDPHHLWKIEGGKSIT